MAFLEAHWPDCRLPIDILSPAEDLGWNANLIRHLDTIDDTFVLLMLDDHFLTAAGPGEYTARIDRVITLMEECPDIALIKLQAGGAWPPEIPIRVGDWDVLGEYDRVPHPFKRTNLGGPVMFRRLWLKRLCEQVLTNCAPGQDKGRQGAIEFEVDGTRITEDANVWPERMLGIDRSDASIDKSLMKCLGNNAVTEGKIIPSELPAIRKVVDLATIEGVEAFLPA